MAYQSQIPQPGDIRSKSQGDLLGNFQYLAASVGNDHNFTNANPSGTPNIDGIHTVVHFLTQGGVFGDNTPAPIIAAPGQGILYTKIISGSQQLFYHQGTSAVAANEVCLTQAPIRCAAYVNGSFALQGTGFNVGSITTVTPGISFRINFVVPMPSVNYIIQATAASSGGNMAIAKYTPANKLVGSVQIDITKFDSGPTAIQGCDVVIIGG